MLRFMVLALLLTSSTARAEDYPMTPQRLLGDEHHYVQAPAGAAAVSLTGRPVGRLVVAYPSGNSGVGLWLEDTMPPGGWQLEAPPALAPGQVVTGAILVAKPRVLRMRAPLGGSLRFLRTYDREEGQDPRAAVRELVERLGKASAAVRLLAKRAGLRAESLEAWLAPRVEARPERIAFTWRTLAGGEGHTLELSVDPGGRITRATDGRLEIDTGLARRLRFRATCAHAPLTPWPADAVFAPSVRARLATLAQADPRRAAALRDGLGRLRFLIYREKMLAGSWRYLTYFGRDTLLTIRMLRDLLTSEVVEFGLASAIARLSPEGQVAHEEDLGDQATLDRARELLDGHAAGGSIDRPVYDYKMVDGDFLLPIALAEYAADPRVGAARARRFLAEGDRAARVLRNARRIVEQAAPYARTGRATDLVALLPGSDVGDWRDSNDGLARGRFAYSLNAVLVPQALGALEQLAAQGVLPPGAPDPRELARMRVAWGSARAHFTVRRTAAQVRALASAYLARGPLSPGEKRLFARWVEGALAGALTMQAVSLDASGRPIPVMCSDAALALFGPALDPRALAELAKPLVTPFPAGLMTPAGMLVASPALSGSVDLWARFARRHYHGTVVWAWPMAMAEMGLTRQLAALPPGARERSALESARTDLRARRWSLSERGLGELWAFRDEAGELIATGFGASAGDVTEANALQLWSASWLALALSD
jgi:hypothetical protein